MQQPQQNTQTGEAPHKPLIMIVEDDKETLQLNARMLQRRGYNILAAHNAEKARELAGEKNPELYILDIILPDGDGLSLCKELRQESDAPIIFLTGQKSTGDRIAGLSGGGDYYLTKPYSFDELIAVVERLLERTRHARKKVEEASAITRGTLTLQIPERVALISGRDVGLTPKEFAVLLLLVQNEDAELPSGRIYEHIWHTPMNNNSGALRVQIARLKKKLDEENTDDFSILYIQGRGYMFTTR